jgi:hypothetical protein
MMSQEDSNVVDLHIDRIVKARWLALGLSPADLAEALGPDGPKDDRAAANGGDAALRLAGALEVRADSVHFPPRNSGRDEPDLALIDGLGSVETLLALRLLRAFHGLNDQATREVLVQLAEQIVKRQDRLR